jgi:multiple sugar transport system substrate-binding protein
MSAGRIRNLVAMAVALMLTLAGCGGGTGGPGSSSGDSSKLVIWHMEQPPNRVAAWQKIIDEFNKTNPSVKVEQQVQDWNQVYTKIAGAVQSRTQPDILFTIPDFTTYVKQMGTVQPVTNIVNEINSQHKFLEPALAAYRSGDEYLAVPLYGMVQMLWYRKDLFSKAGISGEPKTWNQLMEDARKLTTGKQYGIALPAGKNLATDQVVYSFMITAGAENLYSGPDKIAFDNPKTVETFKYYNDLLKFSPPDSANYSWGEPQAAFNNGTAAMAIEKGQYLGPFEKESGRPASDLGCAPIPQPDSGGQPGSIYYSNGAMVLTSDANKQKVASDFFKFVLDPANYGKFLNAEPGLFLPLTEDGADAQSWRSNPVVSKYKECVAGMLEQSKTGALFGFTGGQYNESIGKISGQNIIAQTIQKMYVGKTSPEEAVSWGQEQMTSAVSS